MTKASIPRDGRRSRLSPAKIGSTAQTLREWVKKAGADSGKPAGLPSDVAEKMKAPARMYSTESRVVLAAICR